MCKLLLKLLTNCLSLCLVMGAVCRYNQAVFPVTCQANTFACYDIDWTTNGNGIHSFKICPTSEFPELFR